ncbi:MAG: HPr kinase/phosphatase C-terminal domain-containing protein [Proteobacteria bacterium]|nr:HPr kinase/phosphatase C-terminal domain-containing protein [Pseudomonadota bacterium]
MPRDQPTLHASAVLLGARGVLIRGPSGCGKSRLAWALVEAARHPGGLFARLIADDRVHVVASHGRLVARAPAALAGLIEIRGLGIRRLPYEPCAVIDLVVDLTAADACRLPSPPARQSSIAGVALMRLAVAAEIDPLPLVLAMRSLPPDIALAP